MTKKMLCLVSTLLLGCSHQPLLTENEVDLGRYMGTWYEQYRLPNRFQKQCSTDVSAHYTPLADQQVQVINSCQTAGGARVQANGLARINTSKKPVKSSILEVRFAPKWLSWWPGVWGDYWIIKITDNYDHVLVGSPNRQYLWLLSRNKIADQKIMREFINIAAQQGFAVNQLQQSNPISQ